MSCCSNIIFINSNFTNLCKDIRGQGLWCLVVFITPYCVSVCALNVCKLSKNAYIHTGQMLNIHYTSMFKCPRFGFLCIQMEFARTWWNLHFSEYFKDFLSMLAYRFELEGSARCKMILYLMHKKDRNKFYEEGETRPDVWKLQISYKMKLFAKFPVLFELLRHSSLWITCILNSKTYQYMWNNKNRAT